MTNYPNMDNVNEIMALETPCLVQLTISKVRPYKVRFFLDSGDVTYSFKEDEMLAFLEIRGLTGLMRKINEDARVIIYKDNDSFTYKEASYIKDTRKNFSVKSMMEDYLRNGTDKDTKRR